MTPAAILRFSFIIATLVFLIIAMILRFNRLRRASDIFELFAYAFFLAYNIPFAIAFNYSSPGQYSFANIASLLLFVLSIVLLIYKAIIVIRRK